MKLKINSNALCFFVLAFCTLPFCFAQGFNPDYLEYHGKVLPGTPNAANFKIYGDIPVDHATGIPQINIPLFTIVEDGVSIPISLSYHASGIKVDDLASAVGLKWTLNAGGGIFRQINDKPDETGWLNPSSRGIVNPTWLASQGNLDDQLVQTMIASSAEMDDYYPDDFSYSFSGQSGNFIFDLNGSVAMEEETSLKVVKIAGVGQLIDFQAYDGLGNTYYFNDDREFNTQHVAVVNSGLGNTINIDNNSYTSGWMLDRIVTKNNKEINFTYSPYSFTYALHDVAHSITQVPECRPIVPAQSVCGCEGEGYGVSQSTTYTSIQYSPQNQLPSVIESPTVRVTFNYADDPTLSAWKRKLTSIDILDKIGTKTKSFVFTYGKYGGDPRLRLDEIQEIGFDGTTKPPYKFFYNGGNLPNKGDTGKDDFGYYNGKSSNTTLVPYTYTANALLNNTYASFLANRAHNVSFLSRGVLNRIDYPTGGNTQFEYEANSVAVANSNNPTYSNKSLQVSNQIYATTYVSGAYTIFRSPFTIPSYSSSNPNTEVFYNGFSSICDYDPTFPNIDCSKFNIYDSNGSPKFTNDLVVWADGSDNLDPGDYTLELKIKTSELNANPGASIYIGINWLEQDAPTFYAGGLRVKSVTDRNSNLSVAKTTVYKYDGLVGYNRDYGTFHKNYGGRAVFSSNNLSLNPALIKSGHYYQTVDIGVVNGQDTLRTVERFDPKFRNKSYGSQMVRQEMYRGSKMVQSVDLDYQTTVNHLQFWTLGDKDYCYTYSQFPPTNVSEFLGYNNPNNTTYSYYRNLLQQKTQVSYNFEDPDPFNAVVSIEKYQYNNETLPTSQEMDGRYFAQSQSDVDNQTFTFNTNGEHKKIEYTYPSDYPGETILVNMNNGINFSQPVSKLVYDHSNLVLGQFMEFNSSGNVVATYRYNKGTGSNTSSSGHIPSNYELHEEYTLDNGRPVEIRRANGPTSTMLWDNTDTYVMASIQNATLSQVNALSSFPASYSVTSGLTTTQENQLRSLANSFVTTYSYNPLIGVKTVTDPKAYTMQYEYDGLGRLKAVKDDNGDYVSENIYHYKGQ